MARPKRNLISQEVGSYHIISRVAGGELLFNEKDKEYFLKLLRRFANGFFVQIHAFCIMSNHFHLLVSCLEKEARLASKKELFRRYKAIYPRIPGPPEGEYDLNGELIKRDEDGGVERLRRRLGSISRFVQEIKQGFSRWYNKTYDRKGYLWGDRFKGVIVSKGEAQLTCSAYIDLNPVRADIVKKPEDYRWNSLGLRVRSSRQAKKFLFPLSILPTGGEIGVIGEVEAKGADGSDGTGKMEEARFAPLILLKTNWDHFSTYREFVYKSGGVSRKGKASLWPALVKDVLDYHGQLGITDRFRYRLKNFSEGLAFGSAGMIADFQKLWKRKYIRPRSFMGRDKSCNWSFSTRVLRL
jgi:REP element-mobilizing transposase RayT